MGPLPFAEAEAKQIKSVVPQAKILRHEEANEQNFKKIVHKMQVLHLATHGVFDDRFDSFSGLFMALGSDTVNDGLLLGYEISDMELNSILVTLSACETGRGKTVAGEGVLGLPRLFLGAGTKTVLMTLWKVDDQFTSELMPAFYKNLFHEKMIVADALSRAKLEIMQQPDNGIHYEHPFFWAAFCLYGEPTVVVKPFPWLKWIAILLFILLDMATVVYFYFIRPRRNGKK
jgi:CHAT domain-containing protein